MVLILNSTNLPTNLDTDLALSPVPLALLPVPNFWFLQILTILVKVYWLAVLWLGKVLSNCLSLLILLFRSIMQCHVYIVKSTTPPRYIDKSTPSHLEVAQQVLRYLRGVKSDIVWWYAQDMSDRHAIGKIHGLICNFCWRFIWGKSILAYYTCLQQCSCYVDDWSRASRDRYGSI